jgi:hypothetical protein
VPCPVEQLETVLEPVRDYYGRELSSLETVAAMVLDVELLRGEADRLARVEAICREGV